MLGHPAFVAGDVGGDAEGEALLAEQGVAAVAASRSSRSRGSRGSGRCTLSSLQGQGTSFWPGASGAPTECMQGTTRLIVLVDLGEDGRADAGHDAHVDDDVGRVGELDADLRHGRADRAHAEGQDVHGAAAHAAAEELLELLAHHEGVFPVVGGAGVVFGERADEGAVFDAGDVVGRGAGVEAAGPELLVEPDEGAGFDQLRRRGGRTRPASRRPSGCGRAGRARPSFRPSG